MFCDTFICILWLSVVENFVASWLCAYVSHMAVICVCREIEKLKLSELTCREGVIEVAKM